MDFESLSRRELQNLAKQFGIRANQRSVDIIKQLQETDVDVSKDAGSQKAKRARVQREKYASPFLFAEAVRCCAREDMLSINELLNFRETCKECAEAFKSMDDDVFRAWARVAPGSTLDLDDAKGVSMLAENDLQLVVGKRRGLYDEFSCMLAGLFAHGASRLGELRRAETPGRGKLGDIWELVQEKGERDAEAVTAAVAEMRRREGAKSVEERMAMYRANGGDNRAGIRDAFLRDPVRENIGLREVIAVRKLCARRVNTAAFHALKYTRHDVQSVLVEVGCRLVREHRLRTRFREVIAGTEDIVAILDTPKFSKALTNSAVTIYHPRPMPMYDYYSDSSNESFW